MHSLRLVSTLLLLCAGCVTPPKPAGLTADYYEASLGPDAFRVLCRGLDSTDPERNLDMTLLRACQLVHGTDFSHFAIVDEPASRPGMPVYCAGLNHFVLVPNRGLVIKCFSSRPKGLFTFDAEHLEKILQKKLNLQN